MISPPHRLIYHHHSTRQRQSCFLNPGTGGLRAKRRFPRQEIRPCQGCQHAIITSTSMFSWPPRFSTRGRGLRLLPSPSWGFATAPGLRVPPLGGTPPPRHTYVCRDVNEPTNYLCLPPNLRHSTGCGGSCTLRAATRLSVGVRERVESQPAIPWLHYPPGVGRGAARQRRRRVGRQRIVCDLNARDPTSSL